MEPIDDRLPASAVQVGNARELDLSLDFGLVAFGRVPAIVFLGSRFSAAHVNAPSPTPRQSRTMIVSHHQMDPMFGPRAERQAASCRPQGLEGGR